MRKNKYIKIARLFFVLLICVQVMWAQEPNKKTDEFFIETSEEVSPFEVPSDSKFSQETQTYYTELISRLYNDRNAINQDLSAAKRKKNSELRKAGTKDLELLNSLSAQIEKLDKDYSSIQKDIDKLNKNFKASKDDKEAMKYISAVEYDRYKTSSIQSKKQEQSWDDEFKYLDDNRIVKKDPKTNSDCNIAFNGIDPSSLEKKIQTTSENLIEYTHPKLEEYYKDESFLTGDVSLIEIGGNRFMTLNVTIRSRDALKNYGMIQIGTPLKIELINGESAYLFSATDAIGRPIAKTKNINYQALYAINKSEYKLLKKSEIDNIGIMWSSGYEKYDVYNIDIIQKQIACLENF